MAEVQAQMDKKKLTTFSLSLYGDVTAYNKTTFFIKAATETGLTSQMNLRRS